MGVAIDPLPALLDWEWWANATSLHMFGATGLVITLVCNGLKKSEVSDEGVSGSQQPWQAPTLALAVCSCPPRAGAVYKLNRCPVYWLECSRTN